MAAAANRYDDGSGGSALGLDSNCGPLQLCVDLANPDLGLSHFDSIDGSLMGVYQLFAAQGVSSLLWRCLAAEPSYAIGTLVFFVVIVLVPGQLLANLHSAGWRSPPLEGLEFRV